VLTLLLGDSALGKGKRFVKAARDTELVMSRKPGRAVASTLGVASTWPVAAGSAASAMQTIEFCGGLCSLRIVSEVLSSSHGCGVASVGLGIRAVPKLVLETFVTVSLER
jgi:hypothetical protein